MTTRKVLRTITIDELDKGYKVTTNIRSYAEPCETLEREKVRLELAVLDLNKALKLVKTYLGSDLADMDITSTKAKNA